MKRLNLLFTLYISSVFFGGLFAQVSKESLYWVEPEKGGDVLIKSISHKMKGNEILILT